MGFVSMMGSFVDENLPYSRLVRALPVEEARRVGSFWMVGRHSKGVMEEAGILAVTGNCLSAIPVAARRDGQLYS